MASFGCAETEKGVISWEFGVSLFFGCFMGEKE